MAKRSVSIAGHRTSVTVEEPFWEGLREIAATERKPLATLITEIDGARSPGTSLSSAIRLYVFGWFRDSRATKTNPAVY